MRSHDTVEWVVLYVVEPSRVSDSEALRDGVIPVNDIVCAAVAVCVSDTACEGLCDEEGVGGGVMVTVCDSRCRVSVGGGVMVSVRDMSPVTVVVRVPVGVGTCDAERATVMLCVGLLDEVRWSEGVAVRVAAVWLFVTGSENESVFEKVCVTEGDNER